ncbi:transposase family protein, partial [Streptomyces sp. NPDC090442]|uniref:transposase family protein n=1 Tax=Streptomyces sp. NPDC090442 TaxID=3365962 RepID=UPI00381B08E1
DTIERLAQYAPSLTEALTSHHADGYVLLDGTVAETDRVAAKGHFSGKVRREGVNVQVITAHEGRLLWLSPALPGGVHDVRAVRASTPTPHHDQTAHQQLSTAAVS